MRWRTAATALLCALFAQQAFAHRINEYLQATLLTLSKDRVQASMRLIPGVQVAPAIIAAIDTDHDGTFSESEKREYVKRVLRKISISVDGGVIQPKLESWNLPQPAQLRDGLGEMHIEYAVDLPPSRANKTFILENRHLRPASVYLVNAVAPEDHDLRIVAQRRNPQQTVYQLDFEQTGAGKTSSGVQRSRIRAWLGGLQFSILFHLGMRHIAEGTDHLLFLLTLLLPAPLLARGSRWAQAASVRTSLLHILGIVTAFTIGHSLTLTLAALGFVRVPSRPVEVLIAASIFVSAVHALHPIFPGKEVLIAAFFGLIHGLAFAATLDRLGLARWERLLGIFSFNLGIEAMQMIVVALVLPSLILLSRTRAYLILRIGGASLAATAAIAWIMERLLDFKTPVDAVVNGVARHAPPILIALLLVSLACKALLSPYAEGEPDRARLRRDSSG